MKVYYNEFDPFAADWLRALMRDGLIPHGDVDDRSIVDVDADDLRGYGQCHFFAGIGGWAYALRLAGWPEEKEIWSGSCPCQPFSQAGQRRGTDDPRHLWPHFHRLIAERRPAVCVGEQVASSAGRVWLAGVRADLEALGYAVGAADLCAASVSAPHIRQRLYWVADAANTGSFPSTQTGVHRTEDGSGARYVEPERCGLDPNDGVGDANGYHEHWWSGPVQMGRNGIEGEITRGGRQYRAQWRVKPGLSLLANGVSNRVGKLCGYGNAINPQLAAEVIKAFIESDDYAQH